MPDGLMSVVSGQKALAAASGAVGVQFLAPLLQDMPFVDTPTGKIVVGLGIAWLGAAMADGAFEAILIGIGIGLAARGVVQLAFPPLVEITE